MALSKYRCLALLVQDRELLGAGFSILSSRACRTTVDDEFSGRHLIFPLGPGYCKTTRIMNPSPIASDEQLCDKRCTS
jgi:hypothetical protein